MCYKVFQKCICLPVFLNLASLLIVKKHNVFIWFYVILMILLLSLFFRLNLTFYPNLPIQLKPSLGPWSHVFLQHHYSSTAGALSLHVAHINRTSLGWWMSKSLLVIFCWHNFLTWNFNECNLWFYLPPLRHSMRPLLVSLQKLLLIIYACFILK